MIIYVLRSLSTICELDCVPIAQGRSFVRGYGTLNFVQSILQILTRAKLFLIQKCVHFFLRGLFLNQYLRRLLFRWCLFAVSLV